MQTLVFLNSTYKQTTNLTSPNYEETEIKIKIKKLTPNAKRHRGNKPTPHHRNDSPHNTTRLN